MKKFFIILAICIGVWQVNCQQYLDAIVLKNQQDTIFGKIINTTDSSLVVDRFNVIFDISKDNIDNYILNFRESTAQERVFMQQIDNLYNEDLGYKTAGYYMRKSARSFYVGLPVFGLGTTALICSLTLFENQYMPPKAKYTMLVGGAVAMGVGTFFLLRSFYYINKSGKILDLEKASLYLNPSTQGGMGMQLKF